jgi:hypothetical protein
LGNNPKIGYDIVHHHEHKVLHLKQQAMQEVEHQQYEFSQADWKYILSA